MALTTVELGEPAVVEEDFPGYPGGHERAHAHAHAHSHASAHAHANTSPLYIYIFPDKLTPTLGNIIFGNPYQGEVGEKWFFTMGLVVFASRKIQSAWTTGYLGFSRPGDI